MGTYKFVDKYETIHWINEKNQLHCENGPALIYPKGSVEYYINGKCHREDGPAIIWEDGFVEYWINGEYLSKEEFEYKNM